MPQLYKRYLIIGLLLILLFVVVGCRSGSGPFYRWCEKRDFDPRLCGKYF